MTIKLKVSNMTSGACAKTITQAIINIDPKASVKADLETKQVIIQTQASESSVKEAVAAAGYSPA